MSKMVKIASGTGLVLASILVIAWVLLPRIIHHQLEAALQNAGFPEARVRGVNVYPLGVSITSIELATDDQFSIVDIHIPLRIENILALKTDTILVRTVHLEIDATEPAAIAAIPGYQGGHGGSKTSIPTLPFEQVLVTDIRLNARTQAGIVKSSISGLDVRSVGNGINLAGTYTLDTPDTIAQAELAGKLRADIDLQNLAGRAQMTIAQGKIAHESISFDVIEGLVTGYVDAHSRPELTFHIQSGQGQIKSAQVSQITLTGTLQEGLAHAMLSATGLSGVNLQANSRATLATGAYTIDGIAEIPALENVTDNAAGGEGKISFSLAGNWHQTPRQPLVSGTVALTANNLQVPDLVSGGNISLSGDVHLTGDKLTLNSDGPWQISASPLADALPDALAHLAGDTFDFTVSTPNSEKGPAVTALLQPDIQIASPLNLKINSTKAFNATINARNFQATKRTSGWQAETPELKVQAADLATEAFTLKTLKLTGSSEYNAGQWLINGVGNIDGTAKNIPFSGKWTSLGFSYKLPADADPALKFTIAGLDVNLPDQAVVLKGIKSTINLTGDKIHTATIDMTQMASTRKPATWPPMELSANATGSLNNAEFEAILGNLTGAFVLEAKGQGSMAQGSADLKLYPIMLIPEAQEIGLFLPALGAGVTESTGMVSFDGKLAWADGHMTSSGNLLLEEVGFKAPSADVSGLNGNIAFNSLLPPATRGFQDIRVTRVDPGLPLSNGNLKIKVDENMQVTVKDASFQVAEGTLSFSDFSADLFDLSNFHVNVKGEGLKVANIFALTGIQGLTGDGQLSGSIPLVSTPQGLRIDAGLLDAGTRGTLTYDPALLPGFLQGDDMRTKMLRQVLKNFQYEEFSLKLDGMIGDQQTITLKSRGRNPDFMEGHPIELNVNLKGPLANVLRSTLTPYNLPGALEKEFQQKSQEQKP